MSTALYIESIYEKVTYRNGMVRETIKDADSKLHCEDGPAIIKTYPHGRVHRGYFLQGKSHLYHIIDPNGDERWLRKGVQLIPAQEGEKLLQQFLEAHSEETKRQTSELEELFGLRPKKPGPRASSINPGCP